MIGFLASLLISRNPALALPYAKRIVKAGLIAGTVLIFTIAIALWISGLKKDAREAGRIEVREEVATATVKQVEKVNEVRQTIEKQIEHRTGPDLYAVCLQSARNPAQCKQFLPE